MKNNILIKRLSDLGRDEEGSVIVLVAVTAFILLLVLGAAVDMARSQVVASRLAIALDAAALAVGANSASSAEGNQTEANKYFNVNFPTNYWQTISTTTSPAAVTYVATAAEGTANAGKIVQGPTLSLTTINNTTDVQLSTGAVQQKTDIMYLAHANSVLLSATSDVQRHVTGLEVALVIDNTLSMNQIASGSSDVVNKITAAKLSACQLVTTLYGGNGSPGKNLDGVPGLNKNSCVPNSGTDTQTQQGLWIGLVPFTGQVNIGNPALTDPITGKPYATFNASGTPSQQNWMDPNDPVAFVATSPTHPFFQSPGTLDGPGVPEYWLGCVMARAPTTIDPNTVGAAGYPAAGLTYDESDSPPQQATVPSVYAPSLFNEFYDPFGTLGRHPQPNAYCSVPIVTMLGGTGVGGDESVLLQEINNDATPTHAGSGDTEINQGAVWGFRLLSPNWNGYWGGQTAANGQNMAGNGLPLPYGSSNNLKVMILLTDGQNVYGDDYTDLTDHSHSYIAYGQAGCVTSPLSGPPHPSQQVTQQPGGCTNIYDSEYGPSPGYGIESGNFYINPFSILPGPTSSAFNSVALKAELDRRALDTATVMKNNGIIIYTIGFGASGVDYDLLGNMATPLPAPGAAASARNNYNCTPTGPYCFVAGNDAGAVAAFKNIANQLVYLRITK